MTDLVAFHADDALPRATRLLDEGHLVVLPGDARYVLAADALHDEAVLDVYRVKRRAADQALPVCVAGFEDVGHVADASPLARRLADAYWPGGVTLVLRAKPWLPDALTANGKTVAVHAPSNPFAQSVARHMGPYAATSARRAGEPAPRTATEARARLGSDVALYVDGGEASGAPSTIVDCTGDRARIIREGSVAAAEVLRVGRQGD